MGEEGGGAILVPAIDMEAFPGELDKLRVACSGGCFRIINHHVPMELMAQMKSVVRELFDLPDDVKRKNTDVIPSSGYIARSQKNPLYEAFGLYDMGSLDSVLAFCSLLDATPYQREVIVKYAKAIHNLIMNISEKLGESLGLGRDLLKEWPCEFRINKYHFTPETVGSPGVQIHTDSGFLAILQDDENVGGLEVMDRTGTFIPIDPWPGTFLVNLGDVAAVWSNGRWCNVQHRVQCKDAVVRVSIATFLLGPKEEAIEAPEELIDSEHPHLYAPFRYVEYRKLRLSTKLKAGEALALLRTDS